jgi:SWI/SNF-related matrix-associated actin-dependent regulator 1 of chromatin subfamily A
MMGVGKTAQAIAGADRIGAKRIIVVCPAAVRSVWAGEFKKFATTFRRVLKGQALNDLNIFLRYRADVLLLSYEMATKWAKRLCDDIYDLIIFDESQYLKGHDTQRTRAMLGHRCDGSGGLARWGARVWFLSGTPAPNDPTDIWPFLRFTGGTNMNLRPFTDRYFKSRVGTYNVKQTPRDEMMPELRDAIKAVSLRRTKEEAGLKLPPIWLTTQEVDGDATEIRQLLRGHPGLEQEILRAVEAGGLSFLEAQHIATLRRLVGEAKAPAFVKLITEELENGLDKVVIFCIHRRAVEIVSAGLLARGHNSVCVTGSVEERDRIKAVDAFQRDSAVRAFVGNIRAAGTGLTLTAAADIVMLESDWSPAANSQALNRVHRIGQDRQVRARFISLANSIDDHVTATVARKTQAILKMGFSL